MGLNVDMTVDDLWADRGVSGQAKLARAEIGGQSVADFDRAGRCERPRLQRLGGGLVVKANGRLSGGQSIRLDPGSLTALRAPGESLSDVILRLVEHKSGE